MLSTLYPKGPQRALNIAGSIRREIALFERDFVQTNALPHGDGGREPDEIGERVDAGRLALLRRGIPTTALSITMEDGMLHFHEVVPEQHGRATGDSAAPHSHRPTAMPFRS